MNKSRFTSLSSSLLVALAMVSTASAQLIVSGTTSGSISSGSVTGPGTKVFTSGGLSGGDITWGTPSVANPPSYPSGWRVASSFVYDGGPSAPNLSSGQTIDFGDVTYLNGTVASGTSITGFTLSLAFSFNTSHGAGMINIPLTISTLSVSDISAPPTTITPAGTSLVIPYYDGNPDAATNPIASGVNLGGFYDNPDYLLITLPTLTPTFDFTVGNTIHHYSFFNIGFGATQSSTFFVGEGDFDTDVLQGTFVYSTEEIPVSPIPEPSTYGMMGAGLLVGLAIYRRRRSAKKVA